MTGFVVGSSVSFVGESWIGAIDPSAELSAKLKCNDVWPLQYNYGAVIGAFDSVGHTVVPIAAYTLAYCDAHIILRYNGASFSSADGVSWEYITGGIQNTAGTPVQPVATKPTVFYINGLGDGFTRFTSDAFGVKTVQTGITGIVNYVMFSAGRFILFSTGNRTLSTSTTTNTPLSQFSSRTIPGTAGYNFSAATNTVMLLASNSLTTYARSIDGGVTITELTLPVSVSTSGNQLASFGGAFYYFGSATQFLYSTDGATWVTRTYGGFTPNSFAYANGIIVAYQTFATAASYSIDQGVTWTSSPLPVAINAQIITVNNVMYYKQGNIMYYTTNGATWVTSTACPIWDAIAYMRGAYYNITKNGIYKSTDFVTWTVVESWSNGGAALVGPSGIINYDDLTMQVKQPGGNWVVSRKSAVLGSGIPYTAKKLDGLFHHKPNNATYLSSVDGVTWVSNVSGFTATTASHAQGANKYVYATNFDINTSANISFDTFVTYSHGLNSANTLLYEKGVFVLFGSGSTIVRSVDGVVWTNITLSVPALATTTNLAAFDNGLFTVIYTDSTNVIAYTSTDAITWTANPVAPLAGTHTYTEANMGMTVVDGTCFLSVNGIIYSTRDYVNWGITRSGIGTGFANLLYNNSALHALTSQKSTTTYRTVAEASFYPVASLAAELKCGGGAPYAVIMDSSTITPIGVSSIAFGASKFVFATASSKIYVGTQAGEYSTVTRAEAPSRVAFGAGLFVATPGAAATGYITSPDGITWTAQTSLGTLVRELVWNGTIFCAVCTDRVFTSTTGTTWTMTLLPITDSWTAAVNGSNIALVSRVYNEEGLYSANGTTWNRTTMANQGSTTAGVITVANGYFVVRAGVAADNGSYSLDGNNWYRPRADASLPILNACGVYFADGVYNLYDPASGVLYTKTTIMGAWTARTVQSNNILTAGYGVFQGGGKTFLFNANGFIQAPENSGGGGGISATLMSYKGPDLFANISAVATIGSISFAAQLGLVSNASARSVMTADLVTAIKAQTSIASISTLTGALTTLIQLNSNALNSCTITAAFPALLISNAVAVSSITAQLSTAIPLNSAAAATSTVVAQLTTAIQLNSAAAAISATTAALSTAIKLNSAAAVISTVAAQLTTAIQLNSAAAATSTVVAQLTTAIQLNSAAAATSTVVAQLSTAIPLNSTAIAISTVAAQLTTAIQLNSAAIAISTVAAQLSTAIPLNSAAAATSTTTAQLTAAIQLNSAAAATSTVVAQLSTAIQLNSAAIAISTVAAQLSTAIPLNSTAAAISATTAALSTAIKLNSAAAVISAVVAQLSTAIPLNSAAVATSTMAAALSTAIQLNSAASCVSTVAAAFIQLTQINSAATCVSTATAALTTAIQLNSAAVAISTVAAQLSTAIPLNSAAAAISTTTAALSTAIPLNSAAAATSTTTAALSTAIKLNSAAAAASTVVAQLSTSVQLLSSLAAISNVITAQLSTAIPLNSTATATSTTTAALSTAIKLNSAAVATTTTTAALTTAIQLNSAAAAISTATAALSTAVQLNSAAVATSTITANLTTSLQLISSAVAISNVISAQLSTAIQLNSSANARSTIVAQLTTQINMLSSGSAATSISATLTVPILLATAATSGVVVGAYLTIHASRVGVEKDIAIVGLTPIITATKNDLQLFATQAAAQLYAAKVANNITVETHETTIYSTKSKNEPRGVVIT